MKAEGATEISPGWCVAITPGNVPQNKFLLQCGAPKSDEGGSNGKVAAGRMRTTGKAAATHVEVRYQPEHCRC